jgi:ankyrin repeat protein
MFKRLIASLICVTFSFTNLQYVHAQDFSVNQLPVPGTMIGESTPFAPLALKGLIVNPQKPLEFQFIVDTGNSIPKSMSSPNALIGDLQQEQLKQQATQLVKYFLAGLTIPEGDLWVNLSPYEKDRMVPSALGQTDLGRDLLAQDYILKQLTASLIYPEKDLGKEFWNRVYTKAQKQFGTTNIPVNTFNKVWILPDQAQVFENHNAAYVTKSTLKVMLDEDYLALQKHSVIARGEATKQSQQNLSSPNVLVGDLEKAHTLASQIVREIVIPEITKEVNTGKNFAPLRQIYQALILAKWYKETIQNGLLDAVYINKNKVAGVNLSDPAVKEQIYNRYLQAYKKGAFNYIKEAPTPDGQIVPRKYFSGGILAMKFNLDPTGRQSDIKSPDGAMLSVVITLAVAAGAAVVGGTIYSNRYKMYSISKLSKLLGAAKDEGDFDRYNKISDELHRRNHPAGNFQYRREVENDYNIDLSRGPLDNLIIGKHKTGKWVLEPRDQAMLQTQNQTPNNDAAMFAFLRFKSIDKLVQLLESAQAKIQQLSSNEVNGVRLGYYVKRYNDISDELHRHSHSAGNFRYEWVVHNDRYNMNLAPFHDFISGKHEEGKWVLKPRPDHAMLQTPAKQTPDAVLKSDLNAALLKASFDGNKDEVIRLLAEGAYVDAKTPFGSTPLMKAAGNGHTDVVKLLIDNGAYVNAEGIYGWTALHALAWNGRNNKAKEIAGLLLTNGANVNAKTDSGETPLMLASADGYKDIVERLLLAKGVDVDVENNNGKTALSFARENGHQDIVDRLKAAGAKDQTILQTPRQDSAMTAHTSKTIFYRPARQLVKFSGKAKKPLISLDLSRVGDEVYKIQIIWKKGFYKEDFDRRLEGVEAIPRISNHAPISHLSWTGEIRDGKYFKNRNRWEITLAASGETVSINIGQIEQIELFDKAALATKDFGGIDLNQINMLRNGKTVNVQFDPAQLNALEQGGFEGFTPVIINIQHISSPFQLLGINPPKQEVLAKV